MSTRQHSDLWKQARDLEADTILSEREAFVVVADREGLRRTRSGGQSRANTCVERLREEIRAKCRELDERIERLEVTKEALEFW